MSICAGLFVKSRIFLQVAFMDLKKEVKSYSTVLRNKIIKTLENTEYPMSATEISEIINSTVFKFNKSSFYRQLQTLITEKIIDQHSFSDGINRYEHRGKHIEHHHHLLCTICNINKCIIINENQLDLVVTHAQIKNNIKISGHHLSFTGVCKECLVLDKLA